MQRFLLRLSTVLTAMFFTLFNLYAQETDTTKAVSIDPQLIEWENAKLPKEYTISEIKITGIKYLDPTIVLSISGMMEGDKVLHPGGDQFSKAINNLWRQNFFSNIEIFVTAVKDNKISIEIQLQERPRLSDFKLIGIKKADKEELQGKIGLTKSTIVTQNTKLVADEVITKFYADKGFTQVKVTIEEKPDPKKENFNTLTIKVDKGSKVHVNQIRFYGNDEINDLKLKKKMKGTKEMSKLTLYPTTESSPYGDNEKYSFKEYFNDWGFLSPTKTKNLLDPYFRFKLFSSAKYNSKKFEEDKEKLLDFYNTLGYRDAQIVTDTQYYTKKNNLNIDFKIDEGVKYYFGNISWKGNTKYKDSLLSYYLNIRRGDIYNIEILNKRLGKELSQEGGDISGLYMDDGYLFFRVEPIEMSVYKDTIDYEIRITEGPQATYKDIKIFGNEKTKEHVVRRELRTLPGEKFSRSDLIRSQRELANLQYFNQETIGINPIPNPEDGTVDIHLKLEEKSSDQLEMSAGWGGGIGLTGTLGVTFNNFSIKNILNKSSWDPLPTGDGQKLSIRYQSNGKAFRSYNFSFTEPWLGGKKRNSFTTSVYSSKFSNAFDPFTGRIDQARSDSNYLKTLGFTLSLGKQLKWPDDFFSLIYSLNFTRYDLKNYPIFQGLSNGLSTNVSLKIALQRSSVYDPTFPRSGSNFVGSVQLTPPYSLFNPGLINSANPYRNPEYHKWRFNAEWFVPIGKPMGADKNRQFVLKIAAKYGFMGRYNKELDFSPFERFQVGDAGLTNNFGLLGYDIIAHRGYPVYENSNPSINPDQQNASRFFTMFNKYQLELRFPIITNPSSTIYALSFFEAANGWHIFKDYNPFQLRRSAGVGMRFFLPMFGLLGFDYGVGLDRLHPGDNKLKSASRFTFMLGFEPE